MPVSVAGIVLLAALLGGAPAAVFYILHVLWERKERNLAVLMSYLAAVTARGYPLAGAITALADSTGGQFSRALADVAWLLSQGAPLSVALTLRRKMVPDDYLDLIHSGESAGKLPDVFRVLSRHGAKRFTRRARLFVVAVYPFLLFWALGALSTFCLLVIVPRTGRIAHEFGLEPAMLSYLAWSIWRVPIFFVLLLTLLLIFLAMPSPSSPRRERYAGFIDTIKWWMPFTRGCERYESIRLFAQALQIQLSGGVPFREALQRACQVQVNRRAGKRLEKMYHDVAGGAPLWMAADRSGIFPSRFVHLLKMGESPGGLAPVLDEIVSASDAACDRIVDGIVSIGVPVAVILLGFGVFVLAFSVFGELVSLMNVLWGEITWGL